MCKVYNQIGSLTAIKSHLRVHNVNEYKSVNELINFQKNYSSTREQIISDNKPLIEQEKNTLDAELIQLRESIAIKKNEVEKQLLSKLEKLNNQLDNLPSIPSNIFQSLINYTKKIVLKQKVKSSKLAFDITVENSIKSLTDHYDIKHNRHQYITSFFEDAVVESSFSQLKEFDRKKKIVDEINSSIYGALGEQKVVKEIEKLSDDCILINDFTCRFHPPIYNRQENDYINSVQIDHILLTPSGVFLIETKNWSQKSIHDLNLFSPVQQIKRTNFALYKILNGEISNHTLSINKHHWGDRKIPIRNLIVLINHKPIEEFQYVKILALNDLLNYINYFKPSFSNKETQVIANYLLNFR